MKLFNRTENLTNKKFGRWTVLSFAGYGTTKKKAAHWKCKCACGTVRKVKANTLKRGNSVSCGCFQKEAIAKALRLNPGETGLNNIFRVYKRHAYNANRVFKFSKEKFKQITSSNCHYCNASPSSIGRSYKSSGSTQAAIENSKYLYNGIDRINNNKGYTVENCVTCCKKCNFLKGTLTYKEFLEHITKISQHLVLK